MIRLVLVDDHGIVRHGILQALALHEDVAVVAEAADGRTAIGLVREHIPDVVLMDVSMPDLNGIEATREIARESPNTRVIALSMHSSERFITEMFKAGAAGYLLKDADPEELGTAIHAVVQGQTYLSPAVTEFVMRTYVVPASEQDPSVFSRLSPRERQVLQMLAEGSTTKQIALSLGISPKTVEAHRLRVMKKLEIDNIAQLTKYAILEGLTPPEVGACS